MSHLQETGASEELIFEESWGNPHKQYAIDTTATNPETETTKMRRQQQEKATEKIDASESKTREQKDNLLHKSHRDNVAHQLFSGDLGNFDGRRQQYGTSSMEDQTEKATSSVDLGFKQVKHSNSELPSATIEQHMYDYNTNFKDDAHHYNDFQSLYEYQTKPGGTSHFTAPVSIPEALLSPPATEQHSDTTANKPYPPYGQAPPYQQYHQSPHLSHAYNQGYPGAVPSQVMNMSNYPVVFQPGVGFNIRHPHPSRTMLQESTGYHGLPPHWTGGGRGTELSSTDTWSKSHRRDGIGYPVPVKPMKDLKREKLLARKAKLLRFSKNHLAHLLQTCPHMQCPDDPCSCVRYPGSVLWEHVVGCTAERCYVYQCESTKAVLRHYTKCSSPLCSVCTPTRLKLDVIDKEALLKWSLITANEFERSRKRKQSPCRGPRARFDELALQIGSKPFVSRKEVVKRERLAIDNS